MSKDHDCGCGGSMAVTGAALFQAGTTAMKAAILSDLIATESAGKIDVEALRVVVRTPEPTLRPRDETVIQGRAPQLDTPERIDLIETPEDGGHA